MSMNKRTTITASLRRSLLLGALVLLGGCASHVPDPIRKAPPQNVQPAEVRQEPARFRGTDIRWGGKIVTVRNLKDETEIEIVTRQLDNIGRPREEDQSDGRFLARVAGFVDPAVYAANREVTVSGNIEGVISRMIGDYSYVFPIVRAQDIYLWAPRPPPARYPNEDPFYDPFRSPWYPWGYPYWR